MIIRYKPFIILTIATVASILATQVRFSTKNIDGTRKCVFFFFQSIQSVLELYLTHVRQDNSHFIYLATTLIVKDLEFFSEENLPLVSFR